LRAAAAIFDALKYRVKPRFLLRTLLLYLIAAPILVSCDIGSSLLSFATPTSRILFIGNSFTFINGGVDQQVKELAPSIEVTRLAVGGFTLQDHWDDPGTLRAIRGQEWDYVVLQEQSQTPVSNQAKFLQYAGRLNKEIKLAGAETILFMTWQRPDSVRYGVTTRNLANAYYEAGRQLGARVAPAGLAFAQALQERPGLELYIQDGHPTEAGTYLSACVLYATIFGRSPVGISSAALKIPAEERDFLQRITSEVMGF
jgi:hypothetical protein